MANIDAPRGFEPVGPVRLARRFVSGGIVYPGDCVKGDSSGRVVAAAAGDALLGVSLEYASAAAENIMVSIHPGQIYRAQGDEADLDAQTDVFNMCDILATSGSTTYKTSRMEIDSSTVGTSSAQVILLRKEPLIGNDQGANAVYECMINEHQLIGKDAASGV